ncbi:WxL protein peptidoglycan domain-containing protein [Gryllotalpicola protaetiae]|uniref:DUF916 domain-containing protein n=1 Tax=Gryllotalpicola protaetiae TaxID=2419771 RepID=A0A387BRA7_9MICO|nr:DUF916 domain-containing protein [Gryllotalpicola protaetiae]AYG05112.1 DUF916 domain-containing protein [Gryllotalpicola protaetiae]
MHAKKAIALATAALTAAITLLVAPAADAAGDDVTWAVRTASNDYGAARTSFHYTVSPGGSLTDAITVANQGDEPLELGVYAADGFTTGAGQLDLLRADQRQHGVGAWAQASAQSVAVAPGATAEVPFTISVPKGSAPGDYAGGIVTTLTQPDQAQGIAVDRRLGIRISLRVSGELQPALAVTDAHAHWRGGLNPFASGDATLSYTIRNTGNTTMDAAQSVAASGPFGLFHAKAAHVAAPPSLLPGESWKVTVPIHGVAAAFWFTATTSVTPKFVDASGSTNPLPAVSATATGAAVPWGLLLIILVIAALAVAGALLQRRRRARAKLREDERVQEAVERALAEANEKAPADS